ncbi:MAG: hypothetical protein ACUVV3_05135 [Dehalococcoidia bacterium]
MTKRSANRRSALFLLTASGVSLAAFGLPLLVSPLKWAKRLRWRLPQDTDLAVYLGRSLGAVAVALSVGGLWAARDPWRHRVVFRIAAVAAALLAAVHARGAIEGRQPWTETAEIPFWTAMAVGAIACYPQEPEG